MLQAIVAVIVVIIGVGVITSVRRGLHCTRKIIRLTLLFRKSLP